MAGEQCHVGMCLKRPHQRQFDSFAGVVCHVNDARDRVTTLQRQRQVTVLLAVEAHIHPLQQNAAQRRRPFLGQDVHRLRIAVAGARAQDVAGQRVRAIVFAAVDNAALRPIGVAVLRLHSARRDSHLGAAVGQLKRCRRPGDAAAEDEDVGFEVV